MIKTSETTLEQTTLDLIVEELAKRIEVVPLFWTVR